MTDEQIKGYFDTVPYFVDNRIEPLLPSRFIRSTSHCSSASVNTRPVLRNRQPRLPGYDLAGISEPQRKDEEKPQQIYSEPRVLPKP